MNCALNRGDGEPKPSVHDADPDPSVHDADPDACDAPRAIPSVDDSDSHANDPKPSAGNAAPRVDDADSGANDATPRVDDADPDVDNAPRAAAVDSEEIGAKDPIGRELCRPDNAVCVSTESPAEISFLLDLAPLRGRGGNPRDFSVFELVVLPSDSAVRRRREVCFASGKHRWSYMSKESEYTLAKKANTRYKCRSEKGGMCEWIYHASLTSLRFENAEPEHGNLDQKCTDTDYVRMPTQVKFKTHRFVFGIVFKCHEF